MWAGRERKTRVRTTVTGMSEEITDDEVAVHTGSGTQRDGVIFRASTVISIQLLLSQGGAV